MLFKHIVTPVAFCLLIMQTFVAFAEELPQKGITRLLWVIECLGPMPDTMKICFLCLLVVVAATIVYAKFIKKEHKNEQ